MASNRTSANASKRFRTVLAPGSGLSGTFVRMACRKRCSAMWSRPWAASWMKWHSSTTWLEKRGSIARQPSCKRPASIVPVFRALDAGSTMVLAAFATICRRSWCFPIIGASPPTGRKIGTAPFCHPIIRALSFIPAPKGPSRIYSRTSGRNFQPRTATGPPLICSSRSTGLMRPAEAPTNAWTRGSAVTSSRRRCSSRRPKPWTFRRKPKRFSNCTAWITANRRSTRKSTRSRKPIASAASA